MRNQLTILSVLAVLSGALSACGDDTSAPPPGAGDGGIDTTEPDADGDGISDRDEAGAFGRDTDMDGTPDYLDIDSDNDGLPDSFEAGDADPLTSPRDSDGDGDADFIDTDSDNNGINDINEGMNDTDGDGTPDYADLDDDDDRLPDILEIDGRTDFPRDTDDDRIPDFRDTDTDEDTILDLAEGTLDSDGDGTPDRQDLDSDDDGIPDAIEAGDADPNTAPIDTDGDGAPNYRDRDSDNDGVPDGLELESGTDPLLADTDNDGVSDLIEIGAETDPLDPGDNPRVRGDFVFIVPYRDDPTPRRDTLAFDTSIQFADVYFLFDTTGSMSGEISAMRSAVTTIIDNVTCIDYGTACMNDGDCPDIGQVCGLDATCISDPELTGCIPSLWTGVGTYEGNPNSYSNLLSLQPDPTATQRNIPTSASGGGAGESLFQSAQCVADSVACTGAGCDTTTPGRVGCPAYRGDAIRILTMITDEDNQCTSCSQTPTTAGSALFNAGITFVGIDADANQSPEDDLTALAIESDSLNGAGQPLYFLGDESLVVDAVTQAVREIASGIPLFVIIQATDLPDDDGDSLQFIQRLEVNLSGGVCTRVESRADLDGDGFDDTFPFLLPGTPVCWDVVARRNTTVEPTDVPQLFKAQVTVLGDDSPLDSRTVFFLVPPEIEEPMFE